MTRSTSACLSNRKDTSGRTSSFIGPAVYGWIAAEAALWYQAQGQSAVLAEQSGQRLAILSIAAFFILGLIFLTFVDEAAAREAAREEIGDQELGLGD